MDSNSRPHSAFPTPFGWVFLSPSEDSDDPGAFQQDLSALSSACAAAQLPVEVSDTEAQGVQTRPPRLA